MLCTASLALLATTLPFHAHAQSPSLPSRIGIAPLAQSPDEAWIESLIRQGLPDIAQTVCQKRLTYTQPDSDGYAQWMMLLLYAQTANAARDLDWSNPNAQLDAALLSIAETAKPALQTVRAPWIRWRLIWCRRWLQQRALAAYLAVPSREGTQQWILASIRKALDDTEALGQSVAQLQPRQPTAAQRRANDDTASAITPNQILDLRGDLELLQSDLLLQRSQCYRAGSDDRIAAATEMLSATDRAMQRLPGTWSHRPLLLIARATGQLQLGQSADALRECERLWEQLASDDKPPPELPTWRMSIAALAANACRGLKQWERADTWLERVGGWQSAPELAIEHFALELERNASPNPDTILALKRDLTARFGTYWEQRADALLVSNPALRSPDVTPTNPTNAASLEIFRIEIRQLLAAKKWDAAIEKLGQAESAASKLSNSNEAFAFAMQGAAALESKGDHASAADEFHRCAVSYPEQPKAPQASLMSAWLIRESDPSLDADAAQWRRSNYRQRCVETVLQWPDSPAADTATQWVEFEMLDRDDLLPMLDLWRERLKAHPHPESLLPAASLRGLLVHLATQSDWLEPSILDLEKANAARSAWKRAMLDASPEANLSSLEAWLSTLAPQPDWSNAALDNGPPCTPWIATANDAWNYDPKDPIGRLAILWHASQRAAEAYWHGPADQRAAAIQTLGKLSAALSSAANLRPSPAATAAADPGPRPLALGPRLRERLARAIEYQRICASVVQSNENAVVAELSKLQSQNKKSLWWLYRAARAMQTLEPHRDASLALYRQMATGVPGGSDAWLEARARTAQTLHAKGDHANANQLRDLVFATYPDSANAWRARFDGR